MLNYLQCINSVEYNTIVLFYSSKVKNTLYKYCIRKHGEATDLSLMLLNSERKLSQIF